MTVFTVKMLAYATTATLVMALSGAAALTGKGPGVLIGAAGCFLAAATGLQVTADRNRAAITGLQ